MLPPTPYEGEVVSEPDTSPGIVSTSDDDDVTGAIGEGDVKAFTRKSFGKIASPYISPYVHRRGVLDGEYGLRKIGNRFLRIIPM